MSNNTRVGLTLHVARRSESLFGLILGMHSRFLVHWEGHPPKWDDLMDFASCRVLESVADLLDEVVPQRGVHGVVAQIRALRGELRDLPAPAAGAAAVLRTICAGLLSCLDLTDLPETDLAAVLCSAHVLGGLAAATASWGEEGLTAACGLSDQLMDSIWNLAAGAPVDPDCAAIFEGHLVNWDEPETLRSTIALPAQILLKWAQADGPADQLRQLIKHRAEQHSRARVKPVEF